MAATTCAVAIKNFGGSDPASAYKLINLGHYADGVSNVDKVAGSIFGRKMAVRVSVSDPKDPTLPCELGNATQWELKTKFLSTDLVKIGSGTAELTYLKNQIPEAQGGTDAVVNLLAGGTGGGVTLPLKEGEVSLGLRTKTSPLPEIFLYAQFVNATATNAKLGRYNFNLPLTVTYK